LDPLTWPAPAQVGGPWAATTIIVGALLATIVVLTRKPSLPSRWILLAEFFAVTAFLSSVQVQAHVINGQINMLLALLIIIDVGGFLPRRWGGVLVGVTAAFKLTPLVVIPWYLLTGRRSDAVRATATFVACAIVGLVALPKDSWDYWTSVIFQTGRVGDESLRFNASVLGILARMGVDSPLRSLLWLALGGLLVLAAYRHAARLAANGDLVPAAVVLGCASVVASPISWQHHQIWLPLAGLVLAGRLRWAPTTAGLFILGFSALHVSITMRLDAWGHALWFFNSIDFILFACVCLFGIGRSEPLPPAADGRARELASAQQG
jgi:alpha-1,2-mannosyltransferase